MSQHELRPSIETTPELGSRRPLKRAAKATPLVIPRCRTRRPEALRALRKVIDASTEVAEAPEKPPAGRRSGRAARRSQGIFSCPGAERRPAAIFQVVGDRKPPFTPIRHRSFVTSNANRPAAGGRLLFFLIVAGRHELQPHDHIRLTSHPDPAANRASRIHWAAASPHARGPIIGTVSQPQHRNVIGSMAAPTRSTGARVSAGALDPIRRPDRPTPIRPPPSTLPQWSRSGVSSRSILGAPGRREFKAEITKARTFARPSRSPAPGSISLRCAIDPGGPPEARRQHISRTAACRCEGRDRPGVVSARRRERFGTTETNLRRALFEQTAGMFPELVTRPTCTCSCRRSAAPPCTCSADVEKLANPRTRITCRVHDECNGSDVFGSDICTCRLISCTASRNAPLGPGRRPRRHRLHRKEGRALGEVTKFWSTCPQAPGRRRPGRDLFRAHRCVAECRTPASSN